MKVKTTFVLMFFSLLLFFFPSNVLAQRGCCSWHGGISYCDTNVGSYVCGDGTYSPTCGCTYAPRRVIPTPIQFPTNINATTTLFSKSNGTFDVTIKLDDPLPSQYSAVLNKCKGCDPGPKADFTVSNFTFFNIKSGTYYLNVKKEIDGYWSNTVYYTIVIPTWFAPTPTQIPPTPTIYIQVPTSTTPTGAGGGADPFGLFLLTGFGGLSAYSVYTRFLKSNSSTTNKT